jgi:hypothetical protein
MERLFVRAALVVLLGFPATLLLPAGKAAGQVTADFLSGPRLGIGYAGVMPDVLAGARVWYLTGPRRIGVFADGKVTVPNPEAHANYCPPRLGGPCTIEWVEANHNHWFLRDREHWLTLNGGAVYALSGEFALLVGGGMARFQRFREYVDDTEDADVRITWEGNYLVPHSAQDQWRAQAVIHGMFRVGNRVAFSFGYETAPGGMAIGAYIMVP